MKIPNPLRFRSIEEWKRFLNKEIGLSDLVQPFVIVNDLCVCNPEYEALPYQLDWIWHPKVITIPA